MSESKGPYVVCSDKAILSYHRSLSGATYALPNQALSDDGWTWHMPDGQIYEIRIGATDEEE